jgi:NhaP-type Na+/H+ or K+/H+ antiporter
MMESFDLTFLSVDLYDIGLLLSGLVILVAVILPRLFSRRSMLTAPMLYVAIGALIFLLPWAPTLPDIIDNVWLPKRLTELGVIIALTSAGLKLNRPFARETWKISWRLLAITMPLTIAATAVAGWWATGLVPATALLFGAVIAPTDPVLASTVQTTSPGKPDDSSVRVALTTEAGLNDGLAFPFTNLAIALAAAGPGSTDWIVGWLLVDVVYKIIVGTLAGAVSGWLIGALLFRLPATKHLAKTMTGVAVLSLTLVTYGAAELLSSYGFIAVFVAACVFRQFECSHEYHKTLHEVSEEAERVLAAVLMLLIGAYSVSGLMTHLTPSMWLLAAVVVFVIRPIAGMIGLVGTDLPRRKRGAISFFGIRGIGSIYYLAYGIHHTDFPGATVVWALVVAIVIISVIVHGITARPVMAWVTSESKRGKK